ncbi:MAG: flagellar basal body P-ring protein FlgI [Pedosphaera sp.]|nr:flagellar basal body P-ring protein FlgI [Pedosphaera sp.]MSS99807.1 flagellar basal body P-ring protein FlgI [Pedosphaera sp.]
MTRLLQLSLASLLLAGAAAAQTAGVRIKDLTFIHGARDNQLVGYGLVIGLNGEGDKDNSYSKQTIANMLQRYGVKVDPTTVSSKNVATVIVTADIPPFMKDGARIDVTVSSLGDAKALQGGILIQTPLLGADNKVYAVAQGAVSTGGFSAGGGGASATKNHPTTGQIANGALVEKMIPVTLVRDNFVDVNLREPDFTVSARMSEAVNKKFPGSAQSVDGNTVRVAVPSVYQASPISFIAQIQAIEVVPDSVARIIINERTGTIVATARVRINSCAVSHGNIIVTIAETPETSQPLPLSQAGTTTTNPRTNVNVEEKKGSLVTFPEMPTVEKVAQSLNALGVTPRDMMSIFLAMKQAGALQAELILR